MALSVTRHALISQVDRIECLSCGIDTLDIGFYVEWGADWKEQREKFDERKVEAQGTDGNLIEIDGVRPHIFYAGGKAPNYRYHVKFPEYHTFIGIAKSAVQSPNLYTSFTSEALHWELSEKELIDLVRRDIESLGGRVINHKISRCDLYADFRIPGGLNMEFLRNHMVARARHTSQFMNGEELETFYVGDKGSPIQLRIYDKAKEIRKNGTEERWLLIWFIDDSQDVWRIEAQIRRAVLKQFRIDAIDDLLRQKADLWRYVTDEWISLRNQDNENQARRTVHDFWIKVQSCVEVFGAEEGTKRMYEKKKTAFMKWYVTRIISNLISCAAMLQDYDPDSCMRRVSSRILSTLDRDEFVEKARKKSVEMGIPITSEVKPDAKELFRKLISA